MSVLNVDRHRPLIQSIVLAVVVCGCSSSESESVTEDSIPAEGSPIRDVIPAQVEAKLELPVASTVVPEDEKDSVAHDRVQEVIHPETPLASGETLRSTAGQDLAERLAAKAKPRGVASGAISFTGPSGDGRRGANGVFLPVAGENWNVTGTQLSCRFMRSQSGRWLQLIHPFRDGHVLVTVRTERVYVRVDGSWPGYGGDSNHPVTELASLAAAMPLKPGVFAEIRSRVFSDGHLEVAVDGQPVARSKINVVSALKVSEGFKGDGLPASWPVGSVGVIVGPRDSGDVIAQNIRLEPIPEGSVPHPLSTASMPANLTENKAAGAVEIAAPKSPSVVVVETGKPATPTQSVNDKIKLDTPEQPVVAVWELVDRKVGIRLALFANGSSNHGYRWSPVSRTKLELHDGTGDFKNNGLIVKGRWKGGSPFVGQLVNSNCWIAGTTSPVAAETSVEDELNDFEKGLIGNFQLNGVNR
jgi:hypothetical protein